MSCDESRILDWGGEGLSMSALVYPPAICVLPTFYLLNIMVSRELSL